MITQTDHETIPGRDVLTNSSEQCFMTCPRMYYWSYELGWRPGRKSTPLRLGSALHKGIDYLAKGEAVPAVLDAIEGIYADHIIGAAEWPDPVAGKYDLSIESATVQCLVAGYAQAWSDSPIEIIESEAEFNLPVVNPETGACSRTFRQAGKRDRIGRLPHGRLALMETKTSGENIEPGSDFRTVLAINQQVSKYILAAREEGIDLSTCLYDVVRKPTVKPTPVPVLDDKKLKIVRNPDGSRAYTKQHKERQTADATAGQYLVTNPMTPSQWRTKLSDDIASRPAYYYQRFEVPRLDSDLEEYRHELWWIADSIRQCRNSGHWFRNTSSCRKYNRLCRYYPLCAGEVDTTAGVPAGFRQAGYAHEELTSPDEESES